MLEKCLGEQEVTETKRCGLVDCLSHGGHDLKGDSGTLVSSLSAPLLADHMVINFVLRYATCHDAGFPPGPQSVN